MTGPDPLVSLTFLCSMVLCCAVCLIIHNYQKMISPAKQNILNKLSFFCVFCVNFFICIQAIGVLYRSTIGPLNYYFAVMIRKDFKTLCWGSVTLLLLNISVTGIVRLLCVVQWFKFPQEDPEILYIYLTTFQMILVGVMLIVYSVNFLSKFPNCVDNNLVSYLSQMKRTSLDKDFLSLFVYISLALTFVVLVFTYITIHLYLRLRHSESIKIAERTRHAFKDNIVSLKTMILLVLAGSTVALYHVYNNSLGEADNRYFVPLGTFYVNFAGVLLHLGMLLGTKDLRDYLGRLLVSAGVTLSTCWRRLTIPNNRVAPSPY